MAGTLINDGATVLLAFSRGLAAAGVTGEQLESAIQYAKQTMGQSKSDVFAHLVGHRGEAAVNSAMEAFDAVLEEAIDAGRVTELPGAGETLAQLRSMGLKVCLTTGFSARLQARLIEHLCWAGRVDFFFAPAGGLRGRPYPDMVLAAAMRAQVDDVREVVVAGDTASDLWSGWRAGASVVAGVLSGSDDRSTLEKAPHTHIIASIADLPAIIRAGGA
jgi:phosphonatase-like hydrolase